MRLLAISALFIGAACLDFAGADQLCHQEGRCTGGTAGGTTAAGGGSGGAGGATGGGSGGATAGGSGGATAGGSGGATAGGSGGGSAGGSAGGTSDAGFTLAILEPQPVIFPSGSCGAVTAELRQSGLPVTGQTGTVTFAAPVAAIAGTCASAATTSAMVSLDANGHAAVAVSGAWFGPMTLTATSAIATGTSAQISFVGKPSLTLGPASPIPPNTCTTGSLSVTRSVAPLNPATAIGDGGTVAIASPGMTFFASAGGCIPPAVTQLVIPNSSSTVSFSFRAATTDTVHVSGTYVSNLDVPYSVSCSAVNCPSGCCNGNTCVTPPDAGQCGTNGNMCKACDPVAANLCISGGCTCNGLAPCTSGSVCGPTGCTPKWTQVPKSGFWPSRRMLHSMAWDPVTGHVVLFGGSDSYDAGSTTALGDTWQWDGTTWQMEGASGPSNRFGAALSRGENNGGQLVLTGGTNGLMLFMESYRYGGGTNWSQSGGSRPDNRFGHVQALHWMVASGSNEIVLFGGYGGSSFPPFAYLNDTWEYQNSWNGPLAGTNPPSGRVYAAAASYGNQLLMPGSSGVIMTGGLDQTGMLLSDTYIYGQNSWNAAAPLPTATYGHSMATDDAGVNATWVFGGFNRMGAQPPAVVNTLLLWDGNTWVPQLAYGASPARAFSQLTYDQTRRKLVLFGGTDGTNVLDDLWELQR